MSVTRGDLGGGWCTHCHAFVKYAAATTTDALAPHDARGVPCLGAGRCGFGTVPFGTPPCDRPPSAWEAAYVIASAEAPVATLTARDPETQAERDRDLLSRLHGAALLCLAAERSYHASEGRPWGERIALRRRTDEAREMHARLMGGEP